MLSWLLTPTAPGRPAPLTGLLRRHPHPIGWVPCGGCMPGLFTMPVCLDAKDLWPYSSKFVCGTSISISTLMRACPGQMIVHLADGLAASGLL